MELRFDFSVETLEKYQPAEMPAPKTANENNFQLRMLDRAARLEEEGYRVKSVDAHKALVVNPQDRIYTVYLHNGACSCKQFQIGSYCKHSLGLMQLIDRWFEAQFGETFEFRRRIISDEEYEALEDHAEVEYEALAAFAAYPEFPAVQTARASVPSLAPCFWGTVQLPQNWFASA